MNYGKKKASKKQKQITSKSTMQGKRVTVRLLKAFILCVLAICIIGMIGGLIFVKRILDNSPEVTPDDVRPKGYTTIVYADDGATELERFVRPAPTANTNPSTRSPWICSTLSSPLRTSASMSTTVLTRRVSCEPLSRELLQAATSHREPAR